MKRMILCLLGIMTAISLAACTPTTENYTKTQETKAGAAAEGAAKAGAQTDSAKNASEKGTEEAPSNSVVTDRPVDQTATRQDIISIYTVADDKSSLKGNMDSVDINTLDAQGLVDLLIQYGTLDAGTAILSYDAEDAKATQSFAGPGASAEDSHIIVLSEFIPEATLDLSAIPGDGQDERIVKAVARTFIENLNIETFTLKLNGTVVGDKLTELDVE